MKKKKQNSKLASHEEIVEAWETSRTVQEAADSLGMSKQRLSQIASFLRERGVRLSKRRLFRKPIDVEALNAIIDAQAKK